MSRYSETLMDHFLSPRHMGALDAPDMIGRVGTPGLGPFFILYLQLREGAVTRATFQTYGCGPTIASGSALCEWVRGRSIADCLALTVADLVEALDGVPPEKIHSPGLAVGALQDALVGGSPGRRASAAATRAATATARTGGDHAGEL